MSAIFRGIGVFLGVVVYLTGLAGVRGQIGRAHV